MSAVMHLSVPQPMRAAPIFDDHTMTLIMRVVARRTRHLNRTSREDVFGATVLKCWEEREEFREFDGPADGTVESRLMRWVDAVLRRALRAFSRQELPPGSAAELERLCADEAGPEVLAHRSQVLDGLSERERSIYRGLRDGISVKTLARQLGVKKSDVKELKARLREELSMPEHSLIPAKSPAPPSDDHLHAPTHIDHELNKLDFPPQHGAECPPCVHCSWFDKKWEPSKRVRVEAEIFDADVRKAKTEIYQRKLAISAKVRSYE